MTEQGLLRWFYRIFRLFFCPHRWQQYAVIEGIRPDDTKAHWFILKCRRCGKLRRFVAA